MFLKRLELQGFKSFPEKVKLEFKKGITAVVGPNGSGKSNISDALRWVLGEQSAKNLRGVKMEDIIFAGTKNRKPLGFAEVSMVIDNTDHRLNIDYKEVTITRRVYRSGESSFYINGSACRLKDIHELFMDTGIGKEGYSIIGQGRIDTILSTKSEDRRALFEEAVGIVKFKNRRVQAENKLEEVRANLIRTNDIISELEKQVAPLEKQAEKTKKYLVLADELKNIRVDIFINDFENLEKDIEENIKNIKLIENQIKDENCNQQETEKSRDTLKEKLTEIENQIEKNSNDCAELRSSTEQKENDIKLIKQNIEHIDSDSQRNESEIEKKKADIISKNEEVKLVKSKIQATQLELELKKQNLNSILADFEEVEVKVSKNEELLQKYNVDIVEKMKIASQAKSDASTAEIMLKQFQERKIQVEGELDFSKSKLDEKNISFLANEKIYNEITEKEERLSKRINELRQKAETINRERTNLNQKQNSLSISLNESKSRLKILSELEREYDGYNNSVKAILKQKENNPKFKGVMGAVGELIKVEEKFETAIEIALGSTLQNIVTTDEYVAKSCINYLKDNKKGRATFLPMSNIKARDLGNIKNQILSEENVIGIADEIIGFNDEYKAIMSNLLGRVIIVENIDSAINLGKKYNHSYKIVTLDGEVINAGGSMTGGSVYKKAGGVFSRGREIKNLEETILKNSKQLQEIEKNLFSMENDYKELVSDGERARNILHQTNIEKVERGNLVQQDKSQITEFEEKIKYLEIEKNQLETQLNDAKQNLDKHSSISQEINLEIEKMSGELSQHQEKIQKDRDFKEQSSQKINELKIKISSSQHELNSLNSDINRIETEVKNINNEIQRLTNEIEKNKTEKENKLNEIEKLESEVINLKSFNQKMNEKAESLIRHKNEVNHKIEKISESILNFTQTMAKLENEKVRIEGKIENTENRKQQLCDSMWDDYEITYASACANEFRQKNKFSYDELKFKERSIKSQISDLGNINPDAVEEYKTIKDRYEFNIKQRDDIIKADDDLKTIIAKLVQEMEEQFKSQFKIINENFETVFSEIFGGGTAKLKLTDESNVLTSGIEIVAQPPGKNLQSLTLLSGGERTLTAVSLLFAIFKMKPSPFCILDETEAALDDANVIRYANYLRKISNDNQFIVITHKTGTMEAADVLYGVTMEEQGVSKIISVKLVEAENYVKAN